jgi:hypothetical protein
MCRAARLSAAWPPNAEVEEATHFLNTRSIDLLHQRIDVLFKDI